jgi:Ca-activated chloride channel family protein
MRQRLLTAGLFCTTLLPAQALEPTHCWVVPQSRVFAPRPSVRIAGVVASVRILAKTASTTLEVALHNDSAQQQEAVLLLPVPPGASVSGFSFDGSGPEPTAKLLPRDEARKIYADIVRRMRDPALLEFAGWQAVRSSVFPVPPHGRQRVRLTYEHLLEVDGERCDYVLPRSESLQSDVPWQIQVDLQDQQPIGMIYSPSHDLVTEKRSPRHFTIQVSDKSRRDPGPFRLAFVTQKGDCAASLFAYPDPKVGGGYFLLLVQAPAMPARAVLRDVTVVLDRSGSMAGSKMDQARATALQVFEGLQEGEGMQLIDYGTTVERAWPRSVAKAKETTQQLRAHLDRVRPGGGTNIHDALVEALRSEPLPGTLPIVLFLTDGLPTIGTTAERAILEAVEKGNPHRRRVFCFGVGHDVNAPLLDRIAETTRATTTYVHPGEDVELQVARVFARLAGPALAEPKLTAGAVRELLPARLPDLFAGDQLVVLGKYQGEEALAFELTGKAGDAGRRFSFSFGLGSATTRNAFVPRLWASRQIAYLVDELRASGAELTGPYTGGDPFADPRRKELRDAILRLSTEFGVLSEYTAFLATEGQSLANWTALTQACSAELDGKALRTRTGAGAVNQGANLWGGKGQQRENRFNAFLNDKLERVETTTVQQICDRAFYKRGARWIDSRIVLGQRLEADETVELGSERFAALQQQLESQGRAGVLSLPGEVLVEVAGKNILVQSKLEAVK